MGTDVTAKTSTANNVVCPWCKRGGRGIMVIVVGNRHGVHGFKSWMRLICISHSTNTLGKGMNPVISPFSYG